MVNADTGVQQSTERRVVVVFNPAKIGDEPSFRRITTRVAAQHGWPEPTFLATSTEDPGHGMAQQALDSGATLVLAAGGDGTARVVSTTLSHTKVPCAILPLGTGNLLARNLEIPLDLEDALHVAFTGVPRAIDLAQVVVDHDSANATRFTGMAGVGFDAAMMRDTDERLKRIVKNVAYVVAFTKHMTAPPRRVSVQVDYQPAFHRKALLMIVGNTSSLQGGIVLFPKARPDDGRLDLLLAAPTSLGMWARVASAVLRRITRNKAVDYRSGTRFVLSLDEPTPWEVDGDTEGEGSHFEFSVDPGALLVVTPRPR